MQKIDVYKIFGKNLVAIKQRLILFYSIINLLEC